MDLIIKNMVCPRCILTVEQIALGQGLPYDAVHLGHILFTRKLDPSEVQAFQRSLEAAGFELLDDQKRQLIEKIKTILIQKVQAGQIEDHFSLKKFLSAQVFKDYSHISKLFAGVEGITLEQYFILLKIEKVKELLVYNQLSLNEIASALGYSSVQHLSTQFKKATGMTASQFKELGIHHRKSLDNLVPQKHQ